MRDPSVCRCGSGSFVIESVPTKLCRKRRRVCESCDLRWTTREVADEDFAALLRIERLGALDLIRDDPERIRKLLAIAMS